MIYADNAATTKISDLAFRNMLPFLQEQYGNASSQYSLGSRAKRAIEQARCQVALSIGAEPSEITFTSGGSESNSWVLRQILDSFGDEQAHIITSSIEHHSILNACHALEAKGFGVSYLPVDRLGQVSIDAVKAAIKPNTKLVSIMFANNEIGSIQPIAKIGQYLQKKRILFHTDAVQAVGHVPVNVKELHVDFLAASAHKFNGAKGAGILYKRLGVNLPQLIYGGEQEHGARAGTENVAGIIAAGYALEENVRNMTETSELLKNIVAITVSGIKKKIPTFQINGSTDDRLPGLVNLRFEGISGEALMNILDLKGICVSTGSACTSGKTTPSHVLIALGLSEEQAKSTIRISYGRFNTIEEANTVVSAVYDAYTKIIGTSENLRAFVS